MGCGSWSRLTPNSGDLVLIRQEIQELVEVILLVVINTCKYSTICTVRLAEDSEITPNGRSTAEILVYNVIDILLGKFFISHAETRT